MHFYETNPIGLTQKQVPIRFGGNSLHGARLSKAIGFVFPKQTHFRGMFVLIRALWMAKYRQLRRAIELRAPYTERLCHLAL